jgi:sucrose phosphorylase
LEPLALQAARFLGAHALMLSLQGLPGIYFHSLFGSRGARGDADASGIPRRINRQRFDRREFERDLDNPASLRARVFGGLKEWLRIRREHPAFAPTAPQTVLETDPRAFAVLRESADGRDKMLCLQNVSPEPVAADVQVPAGQWTDQTTWEKLTLAAGPLQVPLDSYQTRWLACQ